MAFVMLAPSLPWPVTLACLFAFIVGLIVLVMESKDRRLIGAVLALAVALVAVVIAVDCQSFPWIVECWCKWCL